MAPTERTVLTATLALVVGAMVGSSATLSPVARVAPLVVGIPTLALLGLELVRDLTRGRRQPAPDDRAGAAERGLFGWLVILLGLTGVVGIALGLPVWLGLFLRLRSGERWTVAAAFAVGLAVVLYGVLEVMLGIRLDGGALTGWVT